MCMTKVPGEVEYLASCGVVAVRQRATSLVPGAASFGAGVAASANRPCENVVGRSFSTCILERFTGDDNSRSSKSEQRKVEW